ncbi:MAG: hypothetical protein IIC73_01205 [Armatimonadetes bacterium]|nr:hypothetical protein [Armatimonadota bacterium]
MAGRRRDPLGTAVGLLTFLAGVGLVVVTFMLAREMFTTDPSDALGIKAGEVMDVNRALVAGTFILFRVILLVLMAGFGSIVANRGIKLYAHGGIDLLGKFKDKEGEEKSEIDEKKTIETLESLEQEEKPHKAETA